MLRSLHVLLRASRLAEHYVDHLGLMAAYFAAVGTAVSNSWVSLDWLHAGQGANQDRFFAVPR